MVNFEESELSQISIFFEKNGDYVMYLGQAMGICPGLMNFLTFDTSGTP